MMPAATAAAAITPMMASQTGRSECSSRGGEEDIFPEGILLIAALSAGFLSEFATLPPPRDRAPGLVRPKAGDRASGKSDKEARRSTSCEACPQCHAKPGERLAQR